MVPVTNTNSLDRFKIRFIFFSKPHHFIRGFYCTDLVKAALCTAYLCTIAQQQAVVKTTGKTLY